MKRTLVLAFVMGLVLGVSGCGESSSKDAAQAEGKPKPNEKLASPEKTLEAIKAVDSRREYSQFCQFFTEEAKRTLAGGLLMSGKDLKGYITNPANESLITEDDKVLVAAVDNLFKKHGVEGDLDIQFNLPSDQDEVVQTKGEQPPQTEQQILEKMGEELSDPCVFVKDFIETMRSHGKNPDARIIEENARLENLTTTNDTAQADLVFMREGREVRRSIGFQNVSGEWHISQVPDVFFK